MVKPTLNYTREHTLVSLAMVLSVGILMLAPVRVLSESFEPKLQAPPQVSELAREYLMRTWARHVNTYGLDYVTYYGIGSVEAAMTAEAGQPYPQFLLDLPELENSGVTAMRFYGYRVPVFVDGKAALVLTVHPDSSSVGYRVTGYGGMNKRSQAIVDGVVGSQVPGSLPFTLIVDDRLTLVGGVANGDIYFSAVDDFTAAALAFDPDGGVRLADTMTNEFAQYVLRRKKEEKKLAEWRSQVREP